jgi:hypothetical protein
MAALLSLTQRFACVCRVFLRQTTRHANLRCSVQMQTEGCPSFKVPNMDNRDTQQSLTYEGRLKSSSTQNRPFDYPPRSNKLSQHTFQTVLLLHHPKMGSFKTTVTKTLMMVRGMKITPLLRYPNHYNLA